MQLHSRDALALHNPLRLQLRQHGLERVGGRGAGGGRVQRDEESGDGVLAGECEASGMTDGSSVWALRGAM
jgi:hypothetical protein